MCTTNQVDCVTLFWKSKCGVYILYDLTNKISDPDPLQIRELGKTLNPDPLKIREI